MYQKHSETSQEAWETMDLNAKGALLNAVFMVIDEAGRAGITAGWIAKKLKRQTGTIAARLIELERDGVIFKTKTKAINPSGKKGHLYFAANFKSQMDPKSIIPPKKGEPIEEIKAQLKEANDLINHFWLFCNTGVHISKAPALRAKVEKYFKENIQ